MEFLVKFPESDRFTAGKERSLKQLLVVLEITLMLLFPTISRVRRFLPLLMSPKISLPFYPASGEAAWAPGGGYVAFCSSLDIHHEHHRSCPGLLT